MKNAYRLGLLLLTLAGTASAAPSGPAPASWLQQMGPNRNGIVQTQPLNTQWAGGKPPVAWQSNVGYGTAPVVVKNGRVYTFGIFKRGITPADIPNTSSIPSQEDVKEGDVSVKSAPGTPSWEDEHRGCQGEEYALCLDAATGKILWTSHLSDWAIAYNGNVNWSDYASPLLAGGKLYLHSLNGRLRCLNAADGKILWERNLFAAQMFQWTEKEANGCGPLLVGDTVIVSYIGSDNPDYTKWGRTRLLVGGFEAATGKTRWVTPAPVEGFRIHNTRLGYAIIHAEPTVLCPCGAGTMGLNPATGKIRWSYDAHTTDKEMPFPYGNYAPVVWGDYVIDACSVAHDDAPSKTWCLQIVNDTPKLVWETHEFVPYVEIGKSNLIARDGKLYGFDAHGVWGEGGAVSRGALPPGRAKRLPGVGRFQCWDIATGKRLWSSDALGGEDWSSSFFLLTGDRLVLVNTQGVWFARLGAANVTVLARIPQAGWAQEMGEPVLADGRLYVRQQALKQLTQDTESQGLAKALGSAGNLTCLDLRPPSAFQTPAH